MLCAKSFSARTGTGHPAHHRLQTEEAPPSARCAEHGVEAPLLREEAQGRARLAVYAHAYSDAGIPLTHEFKVPLAASKRAARGAWSLL